MTVRRLIVFLAAFLVAGTALALEYRAVEAPVAVLYDTPSQKGKKLYIVHRYTPLEVIVRIDGWFKVRDAEGSLAWIEASALTDKRTVVVTSNVAVIRKSPAVEAELLFEAEKWVALELLEPAQSGWAKVQHRDGALGYVKVTQVWGF